MQVPLCFEHSLCPLVCALMEYLFLFLNWVQELMVHRTWDPLQHPEWLVFEAEGQLQIRPTQHWIANHLINHPPDQPGAIDQLNMGEGKTRVILPMLALHWTKGRSQVVSAVLRTHDASR